MPQVSLEQALQMALHHRRGGNFAQAEAICREILAQVPNHPAVLHQLAIAAAGQGRIDEALRLLQQVVQGNPNDPAAFSDLGNVLREVGRREEALAAYQRAVAINPNLAFAQSNLANVLRELGRPQEAVAGFRRALQLEPNFLEAHLNLGNALFDLGQFNDAVAEYREALRINPNFAMAFSNLGVALKMVDRPNDAVSAFRRAIELAPQYAEAHSNLGQLLESLGQLDEAVASYRRAIELNPNLASSYSNLGSALLDQRRIDESVAACRKAVALDPRMPEGWNNLANALSDAGLLDESVAAYREALRLRPNYPQALGNFGSALIDGGRYEEAPQYLQKAIELSPNFADAHWNLGLYYLLRGDFERGLPEYEWRWRVKRMARLPQFPQPQWDGQALNGKSILIHVEQGYGDAIQFARYVPLVTARGGKVILQCPPELKRLFSSIPNIELFPSGPPPQQFDFHCPLVSLMLAFKTDLNSIPANVPYLRADPALAESWRSRLQVSAGRKKIGLAWAGAPTHINNLNRSISLKNFAPLAVIKDADFYSLQKGQAASQAGAGEIRLIDHTSDLIDFADTAALIENLDLVISVDTSVAHLAGALGKPVWVLIPSNPDWRWMLNRSDSPWYPTMRLYRQEHRGDWSAAISGLAQDLARGI
jgi:tetratricopeptide (TPR) repeat protein